jgi:cobalamin biosynthesis protein CobT
MSYNKKSLKNLKTPFNRRDPKEQKEISRRGGVRSGEVRRERKRFKEIFELLLAKKSTNDKGETATIKEIIAINTVAKAVKGDLKAVEIIRDTIGEKLKANEDKEENKDNTEDNKEEQKEEEKEPEKEDKTDDKKTNHDQTATKNKKISI